MNLLLLSLLSILGYLAVGLFVWRKAFVRVWDDPRTQKAVRDYDDRKPDVVGRTLGFATFWPIAFIIYGAVLFTRRFIMAPTPAEREAVAKAEYEKAVRTIRDYERENAL